MIDFVYPVTIHHIYISPGHNYFGHQPNALGTHPTQDVAEVRAVAGQGLEGDRFFGLRPDFDGQVTFFSLEVFQFLAAALGNEQLSTALPRRNVIIEGVPLNQLIGHSFSLQSTDGSTADLPIHFRGVRHCHPCRWMDIAVGPGALSFLKGRGGLRAQIISDGLLKKGDGLLMSPQELALAQINMPLPRPALP